jgi:hypothetical protein
MTGSQNSITTALRWRIFLAFSRQRSAFRFCKRSQAMDVEAASCRFLPVLTKSICPHNAAGCRVYMGRERLPDFQQSTIAGSDLKKADS